MNGYGKEDTNIWCATGSGTIYTTEALAKAAATDTNNSFQLDKLLDEGNGVDAPGYGDITYGYGAGQNNIPGYTSHWGVSETREYAHIMRRDDGNDDWFFITVLQGDYDFGSGKIPSTIEFGLTLSFPYGGLSPGLAISSEIDTSDPIDRGFTTLTDGSCITYFAGLYFDFVIQ